MTIKELIERLKMESRKKAEKGENPRGAGEVLELWYKEMQTCGRFQKIYDNDNYIHGMLHGLYGTYFITEQEFDQLIKEMDDHYHECREKTI